MNRLTPGQKRDYERDGYLCLPGFVGAKWLDRLDAAMHRFIDQSRALTQSTHAILLEPGHRREAPRLRRIPQTCAFDPDFEAFGTGGPIVDLAEDLLGPNVRLHHLKLNFKWSGGGEAIDWHQDIPFWPHSNYDVLTIGVYLCDVDDEMGPMGVYDGSHQGPIHAMRNAAGDWTGALTGDEQARLDDADLRWCKGPRGTVTVHSCRSIHGSEPNRSPRMRPLLLHTYAAGDAMPLTDLMDGVPFGNVMVRGREQPARHDPLPCPMPPDFRRTGYVSIFEAQGGKPS